MEFLSPLPKFIGACTDTQQWSVANSFTRASKDVLAVQHVLKVIEILKIEGFLGLFLFS